MARLPASSIACAVWPSSRPPGPRSHPLDLLIRPRSHPLDLLIRRRRVSAAPTGHDPGPRFKLRLSAFLHHPQVLGWPGQLGSTDDNAVSQRVNEVIIAANQLGLTSLESAADGEHFGSRRTLQSTGQHKLLAAPCQQIGDVLKEFHVRTVANRSNKARRSSRRARAAAAGSQQRVAFGNAVTQSGSERREAIRTRRRTTIIAFVRGARPTGHPLQTYASAVLARLAARTGGDARTTASERPRWFWCVTQPTAGWL